MPKRRKVKKRNRHLYDPGAAEARVAQERHTSTANVRTERRNFKKRRAKQPKAKPKRNGGMRMPARPEFQRSVGLPAERVDRVALTCVTCGQRRANLSDPCSYCTNVFVNPPKDQEEKAPFPLYLLPKSDDKTPIDLGGPVHRRFVKKK